MNRPDPFKAIMTYVLFFPGKNENNTIELYPSLFRRPATIVRHRGYVFNHCDFDAIL